MSGVILAPYLTGARDPQRKGVTYKPNQYDLIQGWYESVVEHDLFGVVFHTECSQEWIEKHFDPAHVDFVKVTPRKRSCNDYRFIIYETWVKRYGKHFDYLLMTDLFDITFYGDPFSFMRAHDHRYYGASTRTAQGLKRKAYYKLIYKQRLPETRPYIIGCCVGGPMDDMRELLAAMGKDWPRVPRGLNVNQSVLNKNAWELFGEDKIWLDEPFIHDAIRGHREKKAMVVHRHYLKDQ